MPSVSIVLGSGNADIDGVLSGLRWSSGALTFSFPTAAAQFGYAVPGFQALNAAQQNAVKASLAAYASVANLSFTQVTESSSTHGTLRFAESDDSGTAYAYYPATDEIGGDAFFNHNDYNSAAKGTYSYLTFLHEIGHTLGMDHGQDGGAVLPYDHDSLEYSVMTYRSYVGADLSGYTVAQGSFPLGPMLADIAALQYMYGANFSTNGGDSVYKWSSSSGELSINGAAQGKSTANKVFQTIWDGGGNDTYDFSNYTTGLTVNLTPGEWSITTSAQLANLGDGHFARGNIANAWLYDGNTASLIENAIGGTGNDKLTGNQAANVLTGGIGNDSLAGLAGNDTIVGGAGDDTCYIGVASVNCAVTYDQTAQAYLIVSSEGTDTVKEVEFFAFTDKTILAGVIDPDAPLLIGSSPSDDSTGVSIDANIVLTFSEAVVAGSGRISIRSSDGKAFQSFNVASNPPGMTIAGNIVTLDPSDTFAANTSYYVAIDAGALKDSEGKGFAGTASKTDLNFTTEKGVSQGTAKGEQIGGSSLADKIYGNGGNDTLMGKKGNDLLDGGKGKDNMSGGRDNDLYVVDNKGDKVVEAANQGTDTVRSSISYKLTANVENLELTGSKNIDGTGNSLANAITGNAGRNTLKGATGADTLAGGDGADKLVGGGGADVLTGGAGSDKFLFSSKPAANAIDTITDFSVADDTILLARSAFSALSKGALHGGDFADAAAPGAAHILYDSATGALFYDKDGAGAAAAVQIALLTAGLALTAADFSIV